MIRHSTLASPACPSTVRPLRALSLLSLAELISNAGNKRALDEFHAHRPAFRLNGGRPLLFVEFVDALRQLTSARKFAGREARILDLAYDLMVDKYTSLANTYDHTTSVKRKGADCRSYFRMVVEATNTWKRTHPQADQFRMEKVVAAILQKRVARNFHLACLEARRSVNPARSRYAWRVGDGVIYVWMPAWLGGYHRRAWLEANVEAPDPSGPGEQQRVQAIIDDRLGVAGEVSLGESASQVSSSRPADHPLAWLLEHEISVRGLAQTVADEKVYTLHRQRPAIRAMGRSMLHQLIVRIFEDMSQDRYSDRSVAQAFGLSKATFSRFAGSRWQLQSGGSIPDLWVNTAQTLAHHTGFIDAARETGVWPRVLQVLDESD